jgi:Zn-dependent protease with chaperone function
VAQWAGVPRPRIYPFDGRGLQSLFMTHPPIPDRVERLRAMAIRARVGY